MVKGILDIRRIKETRIKVCEIEELQDAINDYDPGGGQNKRMKIGLPIIRRR
jgi:hypothetical protein